MLAVTASIPRATIPAGIAQSRISTLQKIPVTKKPTPTQKAQSSIVATIPSNCDESKSTKTSTLVFPDVPMTVTDASNDDGVRFMQVALDTKNGMPTRVETVQSDIYPERNNLKALVLEVYALQSEKPLIMEDSSLKVLSPKAKMLYPERHTKVPRKAIIKSTSGRSTIVGEHMKKTFSFRSWKKEEASLAPIVSVAITDTLPHPMTSDGQPAVLTPVMLPQISTENESSLVPKNATILLRNDRVRLSDVNSITAQVSVETAFIDDHCVTETVALPLIIKKVMLAHPNNVSMTNLTLLTSDEAKTTAQRTESARPVCYESASESSKSHLLNGTIIAPANFFKRESEISLKVHQAKLPSAKSFQSKKKPFPFLVAPKHSQVEPSLPTDITTQTVPAIGFSIKTPLAKSSLSRKSPLIISDNPKHVNHLTELSAEADQVTVYKTKMSKPTIDNHATKVDLTPFIGTNPYCKQQSTGEGELTKSSSPWNLDLASNHFHLHPHNLEDSAQLEMGTTASQGAMGHTITKAMSWTGKPANQRANSVLHHKAAEVQQAVEELLYPRVVVPSLHKKRKIRCGDKKVDCLRHSGWNSIYKRRELSIMNDHMFEYPIEHSERFSSESKVEFVDIILRTGRGSKALENLTVHRFLNPALTTRFYPPIPFTVSNPVERRIKWLWPGSHVLDLVTLDFTLGRCVVNLPPCSQPGDEFLVKWPISLSYIGTDMVVFRTPDSFRPDLSQKKSLPVCVFAPGCNGGFQTQIQSNEQSQRQSSDRRIIGNASLDSQVRLWKSPGKGWKHYKKSSSRVGSSYQVSSFPLSSEWQRGNDGKQVSPKG